MIYKTDVLMANILKERAFHVNKIYSEKICQSSKLTRDDILLR